MKIRERKILKLLLIIVLFFSTLLLFKLETYASNFKFFEVTSDSGLHKYENSIQILMSQYNKGNPLVLTINIHNYNFDTGLSDYSDYYIDTTEKPYDRSIIQIKENHFTQVPKKVARNTSISFPTLEITPIKARNYKITY